MKKALDAEFATEPSSVEAGLLHIDTFIFDLDGTLLDTLPDLVVLTNAVLRECGFPERSSQEILSFVGNGVKALMYQAVPADADEGAVEVAMQRWKTLYPQYGHRLTTIYEGIPETLTALKQRGAKLGVLSNKFDAAVQDVIGTYLPDFFSVIHGECAEIPRKPNPAGLLRTIQELETTPQRTLYVGDSTGDITTARNAQTNIAAVTWGYHDSHRLREAQPDLLIDSPQALLKVGE